MEEEYLERLDKAIEELRLLEQKAFQNNYPKEQDRLKAKIEGVKLAKSYFIEIINI